LLLIKHRRLRLILFHILFIYNVTLTTKVNNINEQCKYFPKNYYPQKSFAHLVTAMPVSQETREVNGSRINKSHNFPVKCRGYLQKALLRPGKALKAPMRASGRLK